MNVLRGLKKKKKKTIFERQKKMHLTQFLVLKVKEII